MKLAQQLAAIRRRAKRFFRNHHPASGGVYPSDVVDLIIFHKLHCHMGIAEARKSFRQLKSEFVDWNEVRVSSVREIQEHLRAAENPLELAVFIKDFLEFLHGDRQKVNLELLSDENLTEIRRYLKQIKGMEPATVGLVLLLRKDHPIVPLSNAMEQSLRRIGVVRKRDTHDRKEKRLHELLGADNALAFHHFLLEHSRTTCPPNEEALRCNSCRVRSVCNYYAVASRKAARRPSALRNGARSRTPLTTRTAARRAASKTASSKLSTGRVRAQTLANRKVKVASKTLTSERVARKRISRKSRRK